MEGKKYNEIAQELHISVKTVEAEISKTLRELRNKTTHYKIQKKENSRTHKYETQQ
jgi:RNA polymerase sigma-70 factor (ECF subfamily)